MKKLLVLALSAIMVLSLAAVSMAAVTVAGEVNFGFNLAGPDYVEYVSGTGTVKEFAASDFGQGDAKVKFTADLNDEVTAFVALKTGGVDEAWASFKEGFGTIKVGYYGWSPKANVDILNPIFMGSKVDTDGNILTDADQLTLHELKSDAVISADLTVAEGVTVSVALQKKVEDMDMGFKVAYATDTWGASVGMLQWNKDVTEDAIMVVNGNYNLSPAVIYVSYASSGDDYSSAVLGASYDSDTFYARAEFEVMTPDGIDDASNGFRLGYKLGNGAKLEYNNKSVWGADAASSIKVNVAF